MDLATAMVDHQRARVAVPPYDQSTGFWFGGGNLVATEDGCYLIGRYRNHGDSRTGLKLGQRGLELAIFHAPEPSAEFEKICHWKKEDLDLADQQVLSIEGSALLKTRDKWELFVSTEKAGVEYPQPVKGYLKEGAGVWTIDHCSANSLESLRDADVTMLLKSSDPEHLHVKDPNLHTTSSGELQILYCTHPFSWSSSNSAFVTRSAAGELTDPDTSAFPRGTTWDVAMTRVTCVVDVPPMGCLADFPKVSLVFYDGGECLRQLDEHSGAVQRPRGYSCEELGGVGFVTNDDLTTFQRLSRLQPAFVSPHGTGCNRYVQSTWTEEGFVTTWQQSQVDLSQPLMIHHLPADRVAKTLLA